MGLDQKSPRTAVERDVGVTGRGQRSGAWQALNSARSEAACLKQGRGLDYLVGRVCPEIRRCGQDKETSLVP